MNPVKNLTFGNALTLLKEGAKLTREGWGGADVFVYYVPAASYPASGNALGTMKGIYKDDLVPYQAYLAIKTADGSVVAFTAGMDSILAEDWEVVELEEVTPSLPPIVNLEIVQQLDEGGFGMVLKAFVVTADGVKDTLTYRLEHLFNSSDEIQSIVRTFTGAPLTALKEYLSTKGEEV